MDLWGTRRPSKCPETCCSAVEDDTRGQIPGLNWEVAGDGWWNMILIESGNMTDYVTIIRIMMAHDNEWEWWIIIDSSGKSINFINSLWAPDDSLTPKIQKVMSTPGRNGQWLKQRMWTATWVWHGLTWGILNMCEWYIYIHIAHDIYIIISLYFWTFT